MNQNKVNLRALEAGDREVLFEWINDRALVLFNAPFRPISDSHHEQWFSRALRGDGNSVIFGITPVGLSKLIGTCQLSNIHAIHRNAELQIRIGHSDDRGVGYGTDAIRALCNHGFCDLNLHRIYLHVFASNAAAARVYEKCNFKREGLLRNAAFIDGGWEDLIVMSVLKDEWNCDTENRSDTSA